MAKSTKNIKVNTVLGLAIILTVSLLIVDKIMVIYVGSIKELSKMIYLDNAPYNIYREGINLMYKGRYDEAMKNFSKVMEQNPKHAKTYVRRAICYIMKEEYNKAWEDINKAKELRFNFEKDEEAKAFLEKLKKESGREK